MDKDTITFVNIISKFISYETLVLGDETTESLLKKERRVPIRDKKTELEIANLFYDFFFTGDNPEILKVLLDYDETSKLLKALEVPGSWSLFNTYGLKSLLHEIKENKYKILGVKLIDNYVSAAVINESAYVKAIIETPEAFILLIDEDRTYHLVKGNRTIKQLEEDLL